MTNTPKEATDEGLVEEGFGKDVWSELPFLASFIDRHTDTITNADTIKQKIQEHFTYTMPHSHTAGYTAGQREEREMVKENIQWFLKQFPESSLDHYFRGSTLFSNPQSL